MNQSTAIGRAQRTVNVQKIIMLSDVGICVINWTLCLHSHNDEPLLNCRLGFFLVSNFGFGPNINRNQVNCRTTIKLDFMVALRVPIVLVMLCVSANCTTLGICVSAYCFVLVCASMRFRCTNSGTHQHNGGLVSTNCLQCHSILIVKHMETSEAIVERCYCCLGAISICVCGCKVVRTCMMMRTPQTNNIIIIELSNATSYGIDWHRTDLKFGVNILHGK